MRRTLLLAAVLLAALGASAARPARRQLIQDASGGEYFSDELIIKFKASASEAMQASILGRFLGKFSRLGRHRPTSDGPEYLNVRLPPGLAVAVAKRLLDNAGLSDVIDYAVPNYNYKKLQTTSSNDPYFTGGNLWGMGSANTVTPTSAFGSQASLAWRTRTDCSSVYVGVIDEGVQIGHNDLNTNIGTNPYDSTVNGADNDRNGFIDDINGWDFVNNDRSVYDNFLDAHGTHVAGTIGAIGRNSRGVAGVCWKVKIMAGKFLSINGGTTFNAVRAIDYFTGLKRRGLNLVATSNSWGGGGYDQALYDAISRANDAGVLFIAAAGNDGFDTDTTPAYPASYDLPNIISVAAISKTGGLASFSNYGATTVDIGAPGVGIASTVPGFFGQSNYAYYDGTSMATPHVTGAAALYKAHYPAATAAQIKNAILTSAVPTPSLAGKCTTGGRLDIAGMLAIAPS